MYQPFTAVYPTELPNTAVDLTDYVRCVAPFIQNTLGEVGDLLDIGAGDGQLGLTLYTQCRHWVAIEPDPYMCNLLSSCLRCSRIIAGGWHEVHHLTGRSFDTVLAAHLPIPLTDVELFLQRCRHWTRDAIVWLVPAGIELLDQLPVMDQPAVMQTIYWSLTCQITDLADFAQQQAAQSAEYGFNDLYDMLLRQSRQQDAGWQLMLPQQSTVLIWKDQ